MEKVEGSSRVSKDIATELSQVSNFKKRLVVSATIPVPEVMQLILSGLMRLKSTLQSQYLDWTCISNEAGKTLLIQVWTNDQITYLNVLNLLLKSGLKPNFESNEDINQSPLDLLPDQTSPINTTKANTIVTLPKSQEPLVSDCQERSLSKPQKWHFTTMEQIPTKRIESCVFEPFGSEMRSTPNPIATNTSIGKTAGQNQKSQILYREQRQVPTKASIAALRASLRSFRIQSEINMNHNYSNITFKYQRLEGRVVDIGQPLQPGFEVRFKKITLLPVSQVAGSNEEHGTGSIVPQYISSIQLTFNITLPTSSGSPGPKEPKTDIKVKKLSRVVYVKGIEKERTSIKQLVNLFECFGDVEIGMFHNKKEFAMVKFKTPSEAKSCIRELYGKEVAGKSLLIHYSDLEELTPTFYSNDKIYYQIPSSAKFDRPKKVSSLSKWVLLRLSSNEPSSTSSKPGTHPVALQEVSAIFKGCFQQSQVSATDQPNEFVVKFETTRLAIEFVMNYNCTAMVYNLKSSSFGAQTLQSILVSTTFTTNNTSSD